MKMATGGLSSFFVEKIQYTRMKKKFQTILVQGKWKNSFTAVVFSLKGPWGLLEKKTQPFWIQAKTENCWKSGIQKFFFCFFRFSFKNLVVRKRKKNFIILIFWNKMKNQTQSFGNKLKFGISESGDKNVSSFYRCIKLYCCLVVFDMYWYEVSGTLSVCCKPSSGAGVVWIKTSLSLGQGQNWPHNGDRT